LSETIATGKPELALREQFYTTEQQREATTLGMWVFLASEVMFFGGLFLAYTVYRSGHAIAFDQASRDMSVILGGMNTAVLITSSFTMALAVHAAQRGHTRALGWFLLATILIGLVFLGIKFTEYLQHYWEHKAPGLDFQTNLTDPGAVEMFFVFYFLMTMLHAVHMIVGIGLLTVLLLRTGLLTLGRDYHSPVVITGLYWHFVDIVWVFLFAIFYLPGLHLR